MLTPVSLLPLMSYSIIKSVYKDDRKPRETYLKSNTVYFIFIELGEYNYYFYKKKKSHRDHILFKMFTINTNVYLKKYNNRNVYVIYINAVDSRSCNKLSRRLYIYFKINYHQNIYFYNTTMFNKFHFYGKYLIINSSSSAFL